LGLDNKIALRAWRLFFLLYLSHRLLATFRTSIMPTSHRATRSQVPQQSQAEGSLPRRTRPPPRSEPELPTLSAVAAGKWPSTTPNGEQRRKKSRKAPDATTGTANQPNPVAVRSSSLREGRVDSHPSPASTTSSGTSLASPLQPSELGSVAAFTGRAGPRSALHSGNFELATVLEAVKRLLERHCYRVSPFIAPSEMLGVSIEWDFMRCVHFAH